MLVSYTFNLWNKILCYVLVCQIENKWKDYNRCHLRWRIVAQCRLVDEKTVWWTFSYPKTLYTIKQMHSFRKHRYATVKRRLISKWKICFNFFFLHGTLYLHVKANVFSSATGLCCPLGIKSSELSPLNDPHSPSVWSKSAVGATICT